MALTNSLVVLFIAVLLQIFLRNFFSNASCFFIVVVIPGYNQGNSQVSVNRTIGPTLVLLLCYCRYFDKTFTAMLLVFHCCGYTWAIVR